MTNSGSALSASARAELVDLISEAERRRARTDPVFFITNFLKTFDPRPEVEVSELDFVLYDYQEDAVRQIVHSIKNGGDIFFEKSRDMGVSWLTLATLFWAWLFEPGFQALIGSRKEEYVDNRQVDSLFGKLDFFLKHIKDSSLIPESFDFRSNRLHMKLINPENGNTILGESSNKNYSRAGRYSVVFYDEFGFWPDARRSWTAGGDATRFRLAVTTPPDEPSFAKVIRFSDKIKVITLHWTKHPKKDQEWYEYERSRRTEEEILHELDISWEYSSVGKPYPEITRCPVGRYPYDETLPLYRVLDIGLDAVAIGYWQPVRNSDWITLVDSYENYDKVIDWYMPFFGKDIDTRYTYTDDDLEFLAKIKYWQPGTLYGDPSGTQRHVESRVSPYTIMYRNYGLSVQINTRENDWPSRKDAAKRLLTHLRINDTARNKWFIECVSSARYPKREEETSQSVTPIVKPVHDWTSHHRTQMEFFAVNYSSKSNSAGAVSTPGVGGSRDRLKVNDVLVSDSLNAILNRGNEGGPHWMSS